MNIQDSTTPCMHSHFFTIEFSFVVSHDYALELNVKIIDFYFKIYNQITLKIGSKESYSKSPHQENSVTSSSL